MFTSNTDANKHSSKTIQAKVQSYMFIATLIAGSTGSILFDYEPHWPFYTSIVANLMTVVFVLFIRQENRPSQSQERQTAVKLSITREQNFWINFYAFSRAFTLAPFVGFLPFFFIQLQLDPYFFGLVLSFFNIAAFISARCTALLAKKLGLLRLGATILAIIMTMNLLVSMILFGCIRYFYKHFLLVSLVAIFLLGLGAGGARPLTMGCLNLAQNTFQQRIKILSLMERRFGIWNTVLLLGGSFLLIGQGFQFLMLTFAALYLGINIVSLASCSSSKKKLKLDHNNSA